MMMLWSRVVYVCYIARSQSLIWTGITAYDSDCGYTDAEQGKKSKLFHFDFFTLGITYKLAAAFNISEKIFEKGLLK